MRVVHDVDELKRDRPSVLAIGTFDGVHRGHQYLIGGTVERARAIHAQSVVMTFHPLPLSVVRPDVGALQLTDVSEKVDLIRGLGVDCCIIQEFTREFANLSPDAFLDRLSAHIALQEIWLGADFAFGHRRSGNSSYLTGLADTYGFAVHVVPRQRLGGESISSTRVRELIRAGDIRGATSLLGHFPMVSGIIVHGAGRGRTLGYPTANLASDSGHVIPPTGIYAGFARVEGDDRTHQAAISVGHNPTFGENPLSVEAYLLDFDEDIWDRQMTLEFADRVRDEAKFDSVDALIEQIDRDVRQTRRILAGLRHRVPEKRTSA